MSENIENTILSSLVYNTQYFQKVLPFIKEEYFEDQSSQAVFQIIKKFADNYEKQPTTEILEIELGSVDDLSSASFGAAKQVIKNLKDNKTNFEWLVDKTEHWCKQRAIYLAISESIRIHANQTDKTVDAIPEILTKALGTSFDEHVGHDYFGDYERRHDFYTLDEDKIPFDLEYFNKITKGGLPRKTLTVALAGTGVGKSLFMCHMAAANLLENRNVLYITMELSEEKVAERIDANLLNLNISTISDLPKQMFEKKIHALRKKTNGKLIIKEYPTGSAHAGHFKALLHELALKKNFKPDIIFVDYLNICASSRFKNTTANSYTYVKAISEELRGLAVQFNVPLVTATQTTRAGHGSSDLDLTDTSESFGLPATADLMFALISNEQLESLNQVLVKQLKNRYNDPTTYKRFVVGIDRSRMKLFDCEQQSQTDIVDSGQPETSQKTDSKFQSFVFN